VESYDELNALLLDKCVAYARVHRHPELRDRTIWEAFETEQTGRRFGLDAGGSAMKLASESCVLASRTCSIPTSQ
jgi:hypothetical protein